MGNLLGKKKKKSRVTEIDQQVLTLKLQRDQLIIFRKKLEVQYKVAEDAAKSLLKEDKKALALLALKRRKQQGELIHQTEEHLLQVNGLISNVEMASMQAEVVKALAQGNTALKRMQSEVSADYVSQLMEENSELQYDVAEVGRMLSQTQSEDPDVFAEYERLEAMVALDIASAVPSVPAAALPEQTTVAKEEEEKQGEEAMVVS